MNSPRRLWLALLSGLISLACARATNAPGSASLGARSINPEMRRAVLRAISDSVRVRLIIDSLPIPASLDAAASVTAGDFRTKGDSAVIGGFSDLVRVGIRAAGDSAVRGCVASLPAPVVWGCPRDRTVVVVVGNARAGGTIRVKGAGDSVETGRGYWSVRVLLTDLYPRSGSALTVVDYVMVQRDGKWQVVRVVPLMAIDGD